MFDLALICGLILLLLILLYKYSIRNFNYWKDKGIPYPEPLPFIGNFFEVFTFRKSIGHFLGELYNEFKTPYFGIYVLNKPYLVIKDRELIKSILITDFNCFSDRNAVCDTKCDPIMAHTMGIAKASEWKSLRAKVSPVFSIAKIKNMFTLIDDVAEELIDYIKSNINNSIDAREISSKYSIDVIATCAFGIEAHCLENENAEFRIIGRKMFDFNWRNAFIHSCYFMAPGIVKLFRMPFFDPSVNKFVKKVFLKTLEERKRTNVKRNDIIDVINQISKEMSLEEQIKFGEDQIVAQPLLFLTTGFETITAAISFAIYELSLNEDVQHKLRKEIKNVLSQHETVTYETLQEMKYMDMVIYETLRKYPPLPFIDRRCIKDYQIPNTDIIIETGTPIFISLLGLHWDPELHPNPKKFDPMRFAEKSTDTFSTLLFGGGPRGCVGSRFGMTEVKIALTRLLSEFEIMKCADTPIPIEFETKCFLLAPKKELAVKFKKINK